MHISLIFAPACLPMPIAMTNHDPLSYYILTLAFAIVAAPRARPTSVAGPGALFLLALRWLLHRHTVLAVLATVLAVLADGSACQAKRPIGKRGCKRPQTSNSSSLMIYGLQGLPWMMCGFLCCTNPSQSMGHYSADGEHGSRIRRTFIASRRMPLPTFATKISWAKLHTKRWAEAKTHTKVLPSC